MEARSEKREMTFVLLKPPCAQCKKGGGDYENNSTVANIKFGQLHTGLAWITAPART